MSTVRGSCVCGAVRFTVETGSSAFQYCHCSRCRKASGSAHAANYFVGPEGVTWDEGEDKVRVFELSGARYWNTAFCADCGSKLPWKTRTGKAWVVPAGAFDDAPPEKPERNIYFGSRGDWYAHASELETFDEFPKRS